MVTLSALGEASKQDKEIKSGTAIKEMVSKTGLHDKFEFTATVTKQAAFGSPVELILILTNRREDGVYWHRVNLYNDCLIQVFDSNSKPCHFTKFGSAVMGSAPGEFTSHSYELLLPKESHAWRIDLEKCFELKPGKYTLAVSHEAAIKPMGPYIKISIDNLPFEVKNK